VNLCSEKIILNQIYFIYILSHFEKGCEDLEDFED
jgi:hypothetical protein